MASSGGAQPNRVFVGNLDWKVTLQDLKGHMSQAGDVVYANIFEDLNGRSKGCAIVEFSSQQDVQTALGTLNDTQLGERLIFIREDRDKGSKGGDKGKGGFGKGKSDYGGGGGGGYGKGKGDYGGSFGKGKSDYGGGKGGYDYYDGDKGKGGKSKGKDKGKDYDGKGKGKSRYGPQDEGRVVYAGNLPFRAAWQDVKDMFKAYGEVIRVDMAKDADGRSRGYATILFEKEEEAQAAIEALNGCDFQGRGMLVKMDNFGY
mmetsp:Transcript_10450/g.23715  ORF Transcript_10450/g.23715 Transcript_10450/m.23715 type:complete len:259 (+) Transcript_10450:139-915(+)|eukprot:CAMPEP_0178419348 /NCGR_PEP_ID=MMETSP0689_2-20121128/25562_1 /TAXON_ID=160604 /ORGANISM="Amphidinium massartii, Strain CS-259" /LENGTH=258 /DNA_ID=CAMNT_0020040779 /DNA_START=120 /DNA_END=896 /DNA_ORIENTATION=-